MNIQDKIGRDLAQGMENVFSDIFKGDQAKLDIIKNTKIYKFFSGKNKYVYNHQQMVNGVPTMVEHAYISKISRTPETAKVIYPFMVEELLLDEIITQEQSDTLMAMINSPDIENLTMCEAVLNSLREKWLKKR